MVTGTGLAESRPSKIVSVMVPIACLYVQYIGPIHSLGLTLFVVLAFYCLKKNKFHASLNRPMLFFSLFYISRLAVNFFWDDAIYSRQGIATFLITLLVAFCTLVIPQMVDRETLFKTWRILGIMVLLVVFYQSVRIYVFGGVVAPLKIGLVLDADNWLPAVRPSGFFSEPAMLAFFLAPLLHMSLVRSKLWLAFSITVALLLSASSIGVIAILVLWLGKFILDDSMTRRRKLLYAGFMVCGTLFISLTSLTDAAYAKILSNLNNHAYNFNMSGNIYIRTYIGFDIFPQLTRPEQLLGIFSQSVAGMVDSGKIILSYTPKIYLFGGEYLNTFHKVLIYTGIVGATFYLLMLKALYDSLDASDKPFLVLQFILIFGSSILYSEIYSLTYIYILACCSKRDNLHIKL